MMSVNAEASSPTVARTERMTLLVVSRGSMVTLAQKASHRSSRLRYSSTFDR